MKILLALVLACSSLPNVGVSNYIEVPDVFGKTPANHGAIILPEDGICSCGDVLEYVNSEMYYWKKDSSIPCPHSKPFGWDKVYRKVIIHYYECDSCGKTYFENEIEYKVKCRGHY